MIEIIRMEEVEEFLEEILTAYRQARIFGGCSMPGEKWQHSEETVLKEPGTENWKFCQVLENLRPRLQRLVEKAFVLTAAEQPDPAQVCDCFYEKLPGIWEIVDSDLAAALEGDPAACSPEEVLLAYPGFMAILVYRLAHELHLLKVPILPRLMTEYAHSRTGIDIHPGAQIGKSFFIDHGTGVVIGETSELGEHVKLYQGVTIGALSTSGGRKLAGVKRHPTIEDHVTIYAGATVLGGNTVIGKNTVIGGNTFIVDSVPESAKVYKNTTT